MEIPRAFAALYWLKASVHCLANVRFVELLDFAARATAGFVSFAVPVTLEVEPNTKKKPMRQYLLSFLIVCCLFSASSAQAQGTIRFQDCNNESIRKQADSLKQVFARDGFQVVRETSVAMESEYEMPVVMPLQEGSWYQFVFIGDYTSRLYEVRMYDWEERMVVYQKKMWGDVDGNIISFSYIPKFSEFHMFKPVQQNKQKKKDLCGYLILLKKVR